MDALVTDLHWAVRSNEVGIIKRLLAEGNSVQSPDPAGRTPIHWAIVLGHEEAFKALLLNTSRRLIDVKDKLGRTPFHYACAAGNVDFASILIRRGAAVNARDSKGRTPLHYAAQNVKADMVKLLLNRGANKDMGDCNGVRPWHLAMKWGCPHGFEMFPVETSQEGRFTEPTTEVPQPELVQSRRISDDFGGDMAEFQKPNSCLEKPSSVDMLLCEWKRAEEDARKTKKGAAGGVNEALKAWRDAETEAKLEKQRNLAHESSYFKHQISSCSSVILSGFVCNEMGEATSKVEDTWSTSEVKKWEKGMECVLGLTSHSQKEPWAKRKEQAPGPRPTIEAK